MVLKPITEKSNRVPAWIIVEEPYRIYNDPDFTDFTGTQFPFLFTTIHALNTWLAQLADNLPEECDFTYNEYTSVRLEEMDLGDKYPLYVYINIQDVWSNHRQGFVVAV